MYTAGFKTIEDIAKTRPIDLVKSIEHMPMKIAREIISAAKVRLRLFSNLDQISCPKIYTTSSPREIINILF